MIKKPTFIMKGAVAAAFVMFALPTAAQEVNDVVDLTANLKGTVYKVNGTQIYVEVTQNVDNPPSGPISINYLYPQPTGVSYVADKLAANAFKQNERLTSVNLNLGITTIPSGAFRNCVKLESVNYEKGQVAYIGSSAFEHTHALKNIDLSGVISVAEGAFWVGGLTEALLPNVSFIADQAFREINNLERVVVGEKCHTIGGAAFASCTNLKEVTLNYGLQEIGLSNFAFSYELSDLVLPWTLTSVKGNVTAGSPLKRLFILSPAFMDFCETSGVLQHSGLSEIYTLDSLMYEIDYFLSINKGVIANLPSVKTKSLSEFVAVEPVPGEDGKFTVTEKGEGITDLKVLDSSETRLYADREGRYSVSDGKAWLVYTVDGVNNLRYEVEIKNEAGDDPSGVGITEAEAPVYRYFDMQGMEITNPEKGKPCIRLNTSNGTTSKIIF